MQNCEAIRKRYMNVLCGDKCIEVLVLRESFFKTFTVLNCLYFMREGVPEKDKSIEK